MTGFDSFLFASAALIVWIGGAAVLCKVWDIAAFLRNRNRRCNAR